MGAWQDPYQTPTVAVLLSGLGPDARGAADGVIERLGRKPKPAWITPWGWALCVARPEPEGPVFFVPDPERPRIAARVPRAVFNDHAPRLSRSAREAIVHASCVGDGVWVEWAAASTAVLEPVFAMIDPR